VAALEGGVRAFAFSSGLATTATVFDTLPHGSHIVASDDLYGGTFRLIDKVRKVSAGLTCSFVDASDPAAIERAITPDTRLIWIETPSNPMLKVLDLEQVAEIGRRRSLITVCDNTFATPYLQRPLTLGFDLVVHSATKYLNGHSEAIGGIAVCREAGELCDRLAFLQNAIGSTPSPFDCFLINRGIKTPGIRMERHCRTAMQLAEYLEAHPKINRVYYPGLTSHPQHKLAARRMKHFGGMISAEIRGGLSDARRFLETVHLFTLAESLGGSREPYRASSYYDSCLSTARGSCETWYIGRTCAILCG
jgi:cystathionine gamma-lyase